MTPRALLVSLLLVSCILPGLSGVHHHQIVSHGHDDIAAEEGGAALAAFDDDHHVAHEHRGEVDVDPPDEAFGNEAPPSSPAVLTALPSIQARPARTIRIATTPLRPPALRSRFLHPPSQAPPSSI